jgi:hypothetical protein
VAAALNAIVSQSQPFINPIMAPNGTVGLPAYSFDSDTNLGMYRVSADVLGFAALGITSWRIAETYVRADVPVYVPDGTSAFPTFTFTNNPDTGLYRTGSDEIGVSINGTRRARFGASGIDFEAPITGTEFRVNTGLVGTAVTQSDTDITAGRLLKTRDYGLGVLIEYSGNINTVADMPTGFYRVTVSATGTMPGGLSGFNMIVLRREAAAPYSSTVQIALRTGTQPEQYVRFYDGSSWSGWQKSYDQGNILGTVSQSGGTPTGAVIQRGSNGNGEFVRFADGTQICTHSISGGATTTAAGSIFTSGDETWTFPQAFTSATGLTVAASVMTVGRWCNVYGTTSSDATIRQFNSSSNAGTPSIRVVAIGRWF